MKKLFVFGLLVSISYLMTACINLETAEQKEQKVKERKEAIQEDIEKDLAEAKDPIGFRDLKKALPRNLAGVPFEGSEGQTSGFLGFKISTVEATYQEDHSTFEVTIVDVAGVGELVKSMAEWTEFEVDKETRNGYERTTEIDGHPALEKYDNRREEGETSILINDRFIISIKGDGVSERQMRNAVDDINLRKITKLGS